MAYLTKEQIKQAISQHPEEDPSVLVQEFINQGHQIEGLNAPKQQPMKQAVEIYKDLNTGGIKGAARTAVDMVDTGLSAANALVQSSPVTKFVESKSPLIQETNIKIRDLEKRGIEAAKSALQPKNKAEKIGGYVESVAEVALPITKAKKIANVKHALKMSTDDLKNLSAGKFKKIFGIDKSELETIGGIIKSESKKMPEKVSTLTKEFKNVLTGGNPTENLKKVKALKGELWKQTLNLIDGSNKTMNESQIRKAITKAMEERIAFQTPFEKKDVISKTIEPFMKQIKSGTLKGLEEARGKLSQSSRDSSGKLKQANMVLHDAVKDYIKNQLPTEKREVYNLLKKQHAKLFDVQEILKAKNAVVSGSSVLKKAAKGAVGVGMVLGAYQGVKNFIKK